MTDTKLITAERLREVLHYDPASGLFTWLNLPATSKVRTGSIAGYVGQQGYVLIKIWQIRYAAHRLAWLYMTGRWPAEQIDHRDRKRSNNKWANLREATHKENHENLGVYRRSASGVRGVTWEQDRNKWLARIKHNGHMKNLGRFSNLSDAIKARLSAEQKLFTHSQACEPQA